LSYSDTNKDGVIQPRQYNNPSCTGGTGPFDPPMCIDNWKPGEIVEVNSYYPFGLMHNYTATTQNAYQYKYNGKELQETGMYDYGARFYMPDIGRWGVVDAMAEAARRWNPYTYAYNNPIRFIDPDGNFSVSFSGEAAQQAFTAFRANMRNTADPIDYVNENGNKIGTDGTTDEGTLMISNRTDLAAIKAAEKNGLHISLTQLNEFTIGMIIPSDAVLKEVVDVKERGDRNGGLREESSSFWGDNMLERGPTGPLPTVNAKGDAIAGGQIPKKRGTHTTIHLHPIGLFVSNGIPYPYDALTPTAGVDDITFSSVGTNIIVGRLAKGNNSNVTPTQSGFNDIRPIGAAIYTGNLIKPVKTLTMKVITNILKRNEK